MEQQQQQQQPLFGLLPTGSPLLTIPSTVVSPTSYIYALPPRHFSHLVVFLLPGIVLPPASAAAVYISTTPGDTSSFRFLGAIGTGKESAVFKVSAPASNANQQFTVGISLESEDEVAAKLATLSTSTANQNQNQNPTANSNTDLVLATTGRPSPTTTVVLAQRIIKNAFNFLASFSGNVNGGVEVVPLKAFEEWWRKFEARVRNDPGFLEKDGD
ncbi:hypothetical protein PVAG01_00874 [Phlyctema vagabunda]|uniref:Hikeshi-like domain-containing protein n=1 Tax=Phlyctema vagabunda TaxID=108571 RepID=A0ABR4PVI6_9HELO